MALVTVLLLGIQFAPRRKHMHYLYTIELYDNSNSVITCRLQKRALPFSTYAPRGGSSLVYISIAYYRGEGVQIACKIAYILNGRPQSRVISQNIS